MHRSLPALLRRSPAMVLIAASLGAMVGLGGTAMAASAGIDAGPAAAAFRSGAHVYVYPGGDTLVDKATQAKLTTELAGSAVYVSVAKTPVSQGDAQAAVDAIAAGTHHTGHYLLVGVGGAGTYMEVSSPIKPHVYGQQLRAAFAAHHRDPAGAALAMAGSLKGDKLPRHPFPWAAVGVGVVLGFLLIVLFAVDRGRRRASSRRRAERVNDMAAI